MRLLAVFGIAFLLPFAASAQALGGLGGASLDPFTLTVSPQYPAPGGEASVSVVSTTLDLTRATLTVSVAGKETYKGAVHSFSVPLGKAGSVTNVKVTIIIDGTNYSKALSLHPQDVVLVAEPIASVPPLYPGKPSVPLEGTVRIVAVASLKGTGGTALNRTFYSYAWTVDGVHMANASGVGKSTIIVDAPLEYRSRDVSVVVTSGDGTLSGGASLTLAAVQPLVRVYEQDPLLGIRFDHALAGTYTMHGSETTLYAAPFHFPTASGAPTVQWFLNGVAAQTGNTVTLRPTGSGQGTASLSLTSSGGTSATALASLSVLFGAKSTGNIFGL